MCVLFVEDEFLIRLIMTEALQDAGLEVLEAATGDEALALIRHPPCRFTALVTDYHMPGDTDGSRVAAVMRRQWPAMPVVIASGRPEIFQPDWRHALGYNLLRKPYMPMELIDLVRQLVDGQAGPASQAPP